MVVLIRSQTVRRIISVERWNIMIKKVYAEVQRRYKKHPACSHFDEHNVNGQEKRILFSSDRISLPS